MPESLTVWNETRASEVLRRVLPCTSFFCRLRGLTWRRRLDSGEGLLLTGRRESRVDTTIHMLFVFFPIAVIWLDSGGRVVDARLARPFRPIYIPSRAARDILEGPPECLQKVRVGDLLRLGDK